MMWILLREPKMNGAIFGFQKRVWCPKWTPASSIWRIVTDMFALSKVGSDAVAESAAPEDTEFPWSGSTLVAVREQLST
jgi:hypothetical protein